MGSAVHPKNWSILQKAHLGVESPSLPRPHSEDTLAVGGSDSEDLESESCGNFLFHDIYSFVRAIVKTKSVREKQ